MKRQKLILSLLALLYATGLVWAAPAIIDKSAPVFTFCMPEMAGQLTFGIIKGEESSWLTHLNCKVKKQKEAVWYTVSDPLLGKGRIEFRVVRLSASDGIVIEVEAEGIGEDVRLLWSYAGASGKQLSPQEAVNVKPDYCVYNVYSVEQTSFTVYYGESMNLKVMQAVMPLTSEIVPADYHQRTAPLAYYRSGKKTDAPALAGILPLLNGQKEYFCVYRQNEQADYNYYMLPRLMD